MLTLLRDIMKPRFTDSVTKARLHVGPFAGLNECSSVPGGQAVNSRTGMTSIRTPTKLYRIGDLVRHTPFSRQTIHNYTIMGLIREVEWTQGGHRLYDESVFNRLSRIMNLRKTKTLSQIREIFSHEDRKIQSC